jgi:hypothetical protein
MGELKFHDTPMPQHNGGVRGEGRWQELVRQFFASGKPRAAVELAEGEVQESVRITLYRAVRSLQLEKQVGVSRAEGSLWLYKKEVEKHG